MQKGRWVLKWDDRANRAGACLLVHYSESLSFSRGIIWLSRFVTKQHSEAEVRNTILHEMAHAMTPNSCKPHGPEWRANARKLGARPKATFDANTLLQKWTGTCPNGHTTQRNRRIQIACSRCCNGIFDARYLFVWTANTGRQPVPTPVRTPAPVSLPVAAQTVKRSSSTIVSRAAEYDAGAAFINWD